MTFWADTARVDVVVDNWGKVPTTQIAAIIGAGCTKNMVISKAHRIGLTLSDEERAKLNAKPRLSPGERKLDPLTRLRRIAVIIEAIDARCMAVDGPVTPSLSAMTQDELSAIYALARGKPETWRPE